MRDVALRYEVCSNQIYRWRRKASGLTVAALAARLVLVLVLVAPCSQAGVRRPRRPGAMGSIELPNGVRLHVGSEIGTAALRWVMAALRG